MFVQIPMIVTISIMVAKSIIMFTMLSRMFSGDLGSHPEKTKVLINGGVVVVSVHDDLRDVHSHLGKMIVFSLHWIS